METYIHFTVKVVVCGYVFYKVWIILFKERFFGFWDKIPVHPPKGTPEPEVAIVTERKVNDVVGKTMIIYLDDPEKAAKVPVQSEKLELSGFIGEEDDISDDDVESELSSKPLTPEEMQEEQERFDEQEDLKPELDLDFSTGLTFEQMANAVGVLTVSTDNEQQIIEAATTIHRIKDTDLFEFFTNQVSNLDNVEKLMNDCLDDDGAPLPERKSKRGGDNLNSFSLNKYV
jgi:hypothetical protein